MKMIDTNFNPQHFIQRYILNVLRHNEYARFRDLKPDRVDSNAFSYHLTQLQRQNFLQKTDRGYTLTIGGLEYIDRVSSLDTRPRRQPKIMTIIAIINEQGEVLVRHKATQPMINRLTMPCGMLHMDDPSIADAAIREVREKLAVAISHPAHIGDCYLAIRHDERIIMNTLMHVFFVSMAKKDVAPNDDILWKPLDQLEEAAFATRKIGEILQRGVRTQRFFEEYVEDL